MDKKLNARIEVLSKTDIEQRVFDLRFTQSKTLAETAAVLGITREEIRRIEINLIRRVSR